MVYKINFFNYLLMSAVLPLSSIATVIALPSNGTTDDCKECLYQPQYTSSCVILDETLRDVVSKMGSGVLCEYTLTKRLVDPTSGLVEFSILLPHNAMNEMISLHALDSGAPPNCFNDVVGVHSSFRMSEGSLNRSECASHEYKKVKWMFNYLYTGCYSVEVELSSMCNAAPFHLESDFIKQPLASQNPSLSYKVINLPDDDLRVEIDRDVLRRRINYGRTKVINSFNPVWSHTNVVVTVTGHALKNDCLNPMISSSCVEITLYNRSNIHETSKLLVLTVFSGLPMISDLDDGSFTWHCYWFRQDHVVSLECSCEWKETVLECTFKDVPPGDYCVDLEALDTRCERNSLWVEHLPAVPEPCLWRFCDIHVKGAGESLPAEEEPKSTSKYWLVGAFGVAAVSALCISIYLRRSDREKVRRALSRRQVEGESSPYDSCEKLIESPQVLLLYARDCKPFMDAMIQLRNLLQRTLNVKVYDIWDGSRQEEIAKGGDVWALKYLLSDDVQVVVVATPISRRIEQSILKMKEICYDVPDSRDEIFFSVFRNSIGMTSTHKYRCKKFIIVRMNSTGFTENVLTSFEPLSTIFTLPTRLDLFISRLRNGDSTNIAVSRQHLDSFQKKIEEYETHVASDPSYSFNEKLIKC